jgi:NAD(P)-dependent dehydrogenase (short-subunit alcohol dehydrogenase family)
MAPISVIAGVIVGVIALVVPILISFIVGGHVALYVSPPYGFNDIPDLTGKVAIVTGSNTGIGYVTVRELVRKGAKVILAARSEKKGKQAVLKIKAELYDIPAADLIEFIKLDLSSFADVRKFAKDFSYKRLKLDMLILNAGVMAPPFSLSVDGIESQMATNHFGHFLLVKLLTPIIKASKSKIVHVSSIAHLNSHPEGLRISSFYDNVDYKPLLVLLPSALQ